MSTISPDWLLPGVGAVMTTRAIGESAEPVLDAVTGATAVWLQQVHGSDVVRLSRSSGQRPVADAAISTDRGIACVVRTADCLPVLFAAPGGVGAAHAGWRGLAAGVLENTVAALCEATGCAPGEIHAWMGACIGPRRFEVGADVLQAFGAAEDGSDLLRFQPKPHAPGKWLANLQQLARDRLTAAGIVDITADVTCTVEDEARFFSYRRGKDTGRMAAAIWRR